MPHQRARSADRLPASAPATGGDEPSVRPLIAVLVVVAIEAVALAVSALAVAVSLLIGRHPHDVLDAWLVVLFAALGAVALGFVWRGLRRHRRWSRAPIVLVALLTLPVGYNLVGNGVWWVGVPLLACGVVGLAGIFAPSTTQLLVGDRADNGADRR